MKKLCIIPARGGSKRIPKKNIKPFCGKPLIAYSIETALKSDLFDRVIVSTDNEEIAKVAKEYGAEVPFMRPKELSDDYSSSGDAVNHAIEFLKNEGEEFRYVCTIYATAPFLQVKYLKQGFKLLKNSDAKMAFSVTSMPFPIQRTFKIAPNNRCQMFTPEYFSFRSQDLEEAYQDAGQFYWEDITKQWKDIAFGSQSIPVILPRYLVQDIDTMEDFKRAELMYKVLFPNSFDKWNSIKQKTHNSQNIVGFKSREIFWLRLGQNIGSEEYGKGNEFQRPVLIVKRLTKELFIGIPLTSQLKNDNDYFQMISYESKKGTKQNCAMLLQLKSFDRKRLMGKIGTLSKEQFATILKKIERLIIPS